MTAQIHERLIYNGEETSMAFVPPLPKSHPRIRELDAMDALRGGGMMFSTACWRRYQGSWEIREGRFYLVGLVGIYQMEGEEPIFADWFSGTLRIPRGEMIQYVHMGFGSVYEQDLLVTIVKGVVTRTKTVDNRNPNAASGAVADE